MDDDQSAIPADLQPGAIYTYERSFDAEDVRTWADLSGDEQDRHFEADDDGRQLIHGLLTASLQTKIGGDLNVLASRMDLHFRKPVYTDQTIHCTWEMETVTERPDRYDIVADVACTVDGETVLDGTVEGLVWRDDVE